jgi:hypothetical protein
MWGTHQIEISSKKPGRGAKMGVKSAASNNNSPIVNNVPVSDEIGTDNIMDVISDVIKFVLYDISGYNLNTMIQEVEAKFPEIPKIMVPVIASIVTTPAWHVSRTSHEVQCFRDSCDDEGKRKYDNARRALLKWFTGVSQEVRGIKKKKD